MLNYEIIRYKKETSAGMYIRTYDIVSAYVTLWLTKFEKKQVLT